MPDDYSVRTPANREWFNLKQLSEHSGFSVATLRGFIHRADDPLPAFQGKRKFSVRRDVYEEWALRQTAKPVVRETKVPEVTIQGVNVNEVVKKILEKVAS